MIIYWVLFLIPAWLALVTSIRSRHANPALWWSVGLLFTLMIGLRETVGCDWDAYLEYLDRASGMTIKEILIGSDPGYYLTNWMSYQLGFGIYGVNLTAAAIVMWGSIAFARRQPLPWLALTVAVPYLLIVVSMGYTRQAVAIGLVMLALVYQQDGKFWRYIATVVIAATFHKTAIVMIPVGILLEKHGTLNRRLRSVLVISVVGALAFDSLVSEHMDPLWENYVERQMQSQGAQIRVAMNLVPGLLILLFWRGWASRWPDALLWRWMALAAIALVPVAFVTSTAVDRMALYLLPIQLVAFSRLPFVFANADSQNRVVGGVILYYAVVQVVWLNFAAHAHCWVPYRNIIWSG